MQVTLFTHQSPLGNEVKKELSSGRYSECRIAVAYARTSGVSRILDDLETFSKSGGQTSIIAGIDQRNTSYQALINARTFADLYIHHDKNFDITFHPKIYAFGNSEIERLFIGSSNLTAGGLFLNYEANLGVELDSNIDSKQLRKQFNKYWTDLLGDSNTKSGDISLLDELLDKGALADETKKQSFREIIEQVVDLPFDSKTKPPLPTPSKKTASPTVSVSATFAMTLSGFDVSSASSDPVVLIPVRAVREDAIFWHFPALYTLSAAGYPQLYTTADVTVDGKTYKNEHIRLYYYDRKKEFRLQCELIKRKGKAGDIVSVSRTANQLHFDIRLHRAASSSYNSIVPLLTARVSPQKKFGYY